MEPLATINERLGETYGRDTISGLPIYRVVWSHDQFEKRLMNITDTGIHLLTPEIRTVPKYRSYINNKWILENLVIVPEEQQKEICTAISYEPVWVFETENGQFQPYSWRAIAFIIDTRNAAMGKQSMFPKYVDPLSEDAENKRHEEVVKLEKELFANETETGDALAHGQGVAGFYESKDIQSKIELLKVSQK